MWAIGVRTQTRLSTLGKWCGDRVVNSPFPALLPSGPASLAAPGLGAKVEVCHTSWARYRALREPRKDGPCATRGPCGKTWQVQFAIRNPERARGRLPFVNGAKPE